MTSRVSSHNTRLGMRRLILRPLRKYSAQAASAAGAALKYATIAATLALVEVVRSSAS